MRGRNTCWDAWHERSLDRKDFRDDHGGGPEEMPHRKKGGKKKFKGKRSNHVHDYVLVRHEVYSWGSIYDDYRCSICEKRKTEWTLGRDLY